MDNNFLATNNIYSNNLPPTSSNNTQSPTPWSHISRLTELSKANPQKNILDLMLQEGEYLASSGLNDLFLGYTDEIEGGIKGLGYGVANLGMQAAHKLGFDIQAPKESFSDAVSRGYVVGRDYRRQVLEDARQNSPYLSATASILGAAVSPFDRIFRVRNTAPLWLKVKTNFNNAIAAGMISGYGNSNTNNIGDVSEKIGLNSLGNALGNRGTNKAIGLGGDAIVRNTIGNAISYGAQKGLSYFLK